MIVFIGSVEVRPRPGAEMYGRAAGGFVYCFTASEGPAEAEEAIKQALHKDRYDILNMEWVRSYSDCEWDTAEQQDEYDEYATEAERSGSVVYAPFFTYATEQDNPEG